MTKRSTLLWQSKFHKKNKYKNPHSTLTNLPIWVHSSTGTSQESLRILMLTPRWKPWWPSLMCTASLLWREASAGRGASLLQRALHKPNSQRREGDADLPYHRQRPGRGRTHCELHSQTHNGI